MLHNTHAHTPRAAWGGRPLAAAAAPLLIARLAAGGGDPWADAVIVYTAGEGANPSYLDADTTVGPPERMTGEGVFPGVVSPFNPPFGVDEIVSIGRGGTLVVRFDEPVTDDASNPFGVDLLIFSNAAFIDAAYPSGIVSGVFSANGGVVELSPDGVDWWLVPGVPADGLFPTLGYLDAGPYDAEPGRVTSDFTRPVDPTLTAADLDGLDHTQVVEHYAGSGGGAGIDLAAVGLATVQFVRITNPTDAESDIQIDALADVSPTTIAGDVTGDGVVDFVDLVTLLAAWGRCPAPPETCAADLDGSGVVNFTDLLLVLANWTG
ncbi:MAG: hypothetical protein HKO59_17445 [Phycisphaerales bacterium]|nr:hypothetical protein [Phycisphaerae bacterium]NNF44239.1 hypothetical protein [Phycisphaerales bacterium]NNM27731.1 hypothetical protein [Phycisphaerales bacterium]